MRLKTRPANGHLRALGSAPRVFTLYCRPWQGLKRRPLDIAPEIERSGIAAQNKPTENEHITKITVSFTLASNETTKAIAAAAND